MDISASSRGCNSLTGRFVVPEYVLSATNEVERLHLTFEQHCEGGIPALRGEISYGK
ncbi:hypothetical protein [Armatimonas rosea]|uniref:Uncharacterized protein n=1 Tax=Armatimonas rosea TaxID=685828 RepID=A0A7W9SWE2_ARMRO|nr:hypothetical protein [Armatimonas rosea]MBB6053633.1 hypothetical protein [Armatimonas rosea]